MQKLFILFISVLAVLGVVTIGVVQSDDDLSFLYLIDYPEHRDTGFAVYNVDHPRTTVLSTYHSEYYGSKYDAVMSPDHRLIAFTLANGTGSDFGLIQVGEDGQTTPDFLPLWRNGPVGPVTSFAWSPHMGGDNFQLALVTSYDSESRSSTDAEIWVMDVPMRPWEAEDLALPEDTWSLYPTIRRTIFRSMHRLTRDDFNVSDIAWSPDGTQMAFVGDQDGNQDIYTLDTDGINQNLRRITDSVAVDASPSWSPDGRWLAFTSDRDGINNIYLVSVDGGNPRQLTFQNDPPSAWNYISPSWSPDGAWIAYLGIERTILISPDGRQTKFIPDIRFVSWLP